MKYKGRDRRSDQQTHSAFRLFNILFFHFRHLGLHFVVFVLVRLLYDFLLLASSESSFSSMYVLVVFFRFLLLQGFLRALLPAH